MSNKTYDTIKIVALVITPLMAFIASMCNIWEVPNADKITATLALIDTLAGAIVVISNKIYTGHLHDDAEALEGDGE